MRWQKYIDKNGTYFDKSKYIYKNETLFPYVTSSRVNGWNYLLKCVKIFIYYYYFYYIFLLFVIQR